MLYLFQIHFLCIFVLYYYFKIRKNMNKLNNFENKYKYNELLIEYSEIIK